MSYSMHGGYTSVGVLMAIIILLSFFVLDVVLFYLFWFDYFFLIYVVFIVVVVVVFGLHTIYTNLGCTRRVCSNAT